MTHTATALATLAVTLLVSTGAAAQDVWSKPLAFPTTCYTKGDTKGEAFEADLKKAMLDLEAEIHKQGQINGALSNALQEMDPGAKQAKMMAFMRKDPAAAQKVMMDMSNAATKQQELQQRLGEQKTAIDEERDKVSAQYKADMAMVDAISKEFPGELENNPPKLRAASLKYNAAYERLCGKWFTSSTSPYAAYLGHFKRFLLDSQIPTNDEIMKGEKLAYDMYGIPSAGWKSTIEMEARKEYLGTLGWFFGSRFKLEPFPIH